MNSAVNPLVSVKALRKAFPLPLDLAGRLQRRPQAKVLALDSVDIDIAQGITTAVVGESGSGKSTLGRCILRLIEPDEGVILFNGIDVRDADSAALRRLRRRMQMVFQDPYSSLNPRMTVSQTLGEILAFHGVGTGRERSERILGLLRDVGLDPSHAGRYPHEFSGGQRQRIGIARALALGPDFIVLDEPVSALDLSVQAQIINLLEDLQEARGLTYLFVAHDLSVVRHIAERVVVMYLGRIVEEAQTDELFGHPHHPYTSALLSAVPSVDPGNRSRRIIVGGEVSTAVAAPGACPFQPRCRFAMEKCKKAPPLVEVATSHFSRCWLDAVPQAAANPLPPE
jgi:oligopeptide/dipeptide ABC transporter ATP-binding protein